MTELVIQLNVLLAVGGVLLLAIAAVLFVDVFFCRRKYYGAYVEKFGILALAALTIGASVMTLVYSEIFGFVPCGLCWLQRIFLYPQAIMLPIAHFVKDKTIALYGIALSIPGLLTALYQHYWQMGGSAVLGCPTSGGDCGQRILFEFGFMTYPLMSAALFLVLIAVYLYFVRR